MTDYFNGVKYEMFNHEFYDVKKIISREKIYKFFQLPITSNRVTNYAGHLYKNQTFTIKKFRLSFLHPIDRRILLKTKCFFSRCSKADREYNIIDLLTEHNNFLTGLTLEPIDRYLIEFNITFSFTIIFPEIIKNMESNLLRMMISGEMVQPF